MSEESASASATNRWNPITLLSNAWFATRKWVNDHSLIALALGLGLVGVAVFAGFVLALGLPAVLAGLKLAALWLFTTKTGLFLTGCLTAMTVGGLSFITAYSWYNFKKMSQDADKQAQYDKEQGKYNGYAIIGMTLGAIAFAGGAIAAAGLLIFGAKLFQASLFLGAKKAILWAPIVFHWFADTTVGHIVGGIIVTALTTVLAAAGFKHWWHSRNQPLLPGKNPAKKRKKSSKSSKGNEDNKDEVSDKASLPEIELLDDTHKKQKTNCLEQADKLQYEVNEIATLLEEMQMQMRGNEGVIAFSSDLLAYAATKNKEKYLHPRNQPDWIKPDQAKGKSACFAYCDQLDRLYAWASQVSAKVKSSHISIHTELGELTTPKAEKALIDAHNKQVVAQQTYLTKEVGKSKRSQASEDVSELKCRCSQVKKYRQALLHGGTVQANKHCYEQGKNPKAPYEQIEVSEGLVSIIEGLAKHLEKRAKILQSIPKKKKGLGRENKTKATQKASEAVIENINQFSTENKIENLHEALAQVLKGYSLLKDVELMLQKPGVIDNFDTALEKAEKSYEEKLKKKASKAAKKGGGSRSGSRFSFRRNKTEVSAVLDPESPINSPRIVHQGGGLFFHAVGVSAQQFSLPSYFPESLSCHPERSEGSQGNLEIFELDP